MKPIYKLMLTSLLYWIFSAVWANPMAYAPDKKIVVAASSNKIWYRKVELEDTQEDVNDTYWHEAKGVEGTAKFKAVIYAEGFKSDQGKGLFQAIADQGTIWHSYDGITWKIAKNLTGKTRFQSVIYAENSTSSKFFAVGYNLLNGVIKGGLWSSSDGVNWKNRQTVTRPLDLRALAYDGKNTIVAVGAGSVKFVGGYQYLYSDNGGQSFTGGNLDSTIDFHDVTYANGLFVAVGGRGIIYYSTNGKDWTMVTGLGGGASLNKVGYLPGSKPGEGKFIVVGDAATAFNSTDGKTWVRANIQGKTNLNRLSIGTIEGGQTVAIAAGDGGDQIFSSTNGISWELTSVNQPLSGVYAITQIHNGQFYALSTPAENLVTYTSKDGKSWLVEGP